jgi:formylglycine-generating enzyme required for sulfatase activity
MKTAVYFAVQLFFALVPNMRYILNFIILLIILNLVSCNKISSDNKQSSEGKKINFIDRKSGTPMTRSALGRLAKQTTIEIVREGYLTGGDKYIPKGSGVIIGKKDSIYYVLTANHISNNDDGLLAFIRSEKSGKAGEILPLKFIRRYPKKDLAVVAFASLTDYIVIELDLINKLDNNNQIYIVGWPGAEDRDGFQFTPAKVTNPKIGNNLTYQPTEPGEDLYKGMSGGAVLNERGQLVGIHVGLTQLDGDGEGVLISTFLSEVPQEIENLLVWSNSSEKEENLTVIVPKDTTSSPKLSFNFWWLFNGLVIMGSGSLIYLTLRYFQNFQMPQVSNLVNKFQKQSRQEAVTNSKIVQKTQKEKKLNNSTENKSYQLPKFRLPKESEKEELFNFEIVQKTQKEKKLNNSTENKSYQLPKVRLPQESEKEELFNFEVVKVNDSGSIVNRSQGSARQKIEDLGNGVSLEMVKIPGGTFTMGSPESEEGSRERERPQHDVTVAQFFMGKYPVTQGQWIAIASRTDLKVELDLKPEPSYFKEPYKGIDRWQRPVEEVSWYEAVEFCKRLSKLTRRNYRLPSEAEWEYACRARTTTPFHFGETISTDLANYCGTDHYLSGSYGKGPKGVYRKETTPVGQFPPNAFGLYDMHGNVREWCADELHNNYQNAPTDGSIWLNGDKDKSPLRGGSWGYDPDYCRSAIRDNFIRRDDLDLITGFRVVCDGGRTL